MANDFSGDSACAALYNFESGALTADSIGNNTLTDNNTVGVDTVNYMQGSASADFEADNSESLSRADADLSSDFPFKSGGSEVNISIADWFILESHAADMVLFSKYSTTGDQRGFCLRTESVNPHLRLIIGYNGGASFETIYLTSDNSLQVGRWYHVGVTYNRTTRAWTCRMWDDTAQTVVENNSGTGTQTLYINTVPVYIGCYGQEIGYFDGRQDELVIFNDIKSSSDFDSIRQGTYGTTYTLMVEAGSMALTSQNTTLLLNRTIGIKDIYHKNYLSSNSNLLRERYLSVFNSLLNFYSSIFDLIYYKLLNILNTIHNNNSIVDLNLKLEKLLLTDKILHEQFANNIFVFLAGITDLSVKSIYHKNYLSSNSNLLRERYLSVFNSLLNFYSSIFDLIYYKLLNILNTIHNNNSIVDLNLKLEKLLLTDKILHEQFANNIFDLILNKIFEIISSILGNNSSVIENIISKGIVVKDSYHDNYENVINIILRDLVISSINCVNDLINDVVENEIDISIVVDNILNEIFSSNNNLDVQLAGSIGLIIFDSIISMYSGKSVLTVTEIATLYNFIAKNTLYNFIAKNTLYNFIAKKI